MLKKKNMDSPIPVFVWLIFVSYLIVNCGAVYKGGI